MILGLLTLLSLFLGSSVASLVEKNFKVYDCFPYSGEIELLKERMIYLENVVDYFVIANTW